MAINPLQSPVNYLASIPKPDLGASLLQGLQLGSAMRDISAKRADEQRAEEARKQYSADLQNAIANPSQKTWADMIAKYPQQREAFKESAKMYGEERITNEFWQGAEISNALELNKPEVAKEKLSQIIEAKKNSGESFGVYKQALDAIEAGNTKGAQAITNFALSMMDPDKFSKIGEERRAEEAQPWDIAKRAGEVKKLLAEATKFERDVVRETGDTVQSSKILPDGTVVIVTKGGSTRVVGSDGREIQGQERVDAVRNAEEFGADVQALRAGGRKGGEIGQDISQKAFTGLEKVRSNIVNLDAAIAALDKGATTGVISSKMPNWKASTIELKNIQNRLGLDVVGSVTFGALSEGELSLAMETALPTNMNEKELRDWLVRKKEAQNKVAVYLSDQARYLSVPGRTIGDWMDYAETKYKPAQSAQQTGSRASYQPGQAAPAAPRTVTVDY